MYAVIDFSGRQYRVEEGDRVVVDRLDAEVGSTVEIDRVLLLGGGEDGPRIGAPVVEGAVVRAEVVEHFLGDKRDAFRYRRRKRTRVRRGGRPRMTALRIQQITA